MIKKEDISLATRKGLDIIGHLYPDALRIIQSGKMGDAFKVRPQERTPSAHMKEKEMWYVVTDFGGDQVPRNPIDCWMRERGLGFNEALISIVTELSLQIDDIRPDVNKPRYEKMLDATPDMREGEWYYELNERLTDEELRVMGPTVRHEDAEALGWFSVKWVGKCKDRKITKKYSTPTYPIFMRQCVNPDGTSFYKKYEPLCYDKQWRFMYIGTKPRQYINGLRELTIAYDRLNEEKRKEWESDPVNEGKPYHEIKLQEAVICSGERDAICCHSLGYHPLWLNSETAELDDDEYRQITRLVLCVYNIPDKDATGLVRGRELALRHLDIHTIWLPSRFERFLDSRRRPRKDFRDWLETQDQPRKAMSALIAQATPARFWEERISKKGERSYTISSVSLLYFLKLQGFCKLRDRESGKSDFVRIRGNVVERVSAADVVEYLMSWSAGTERRSPLCDHPSDVQPAEIRNLIIDSPRTSTAALDRLATVELDFTSSTPTSQLFFFDGTTVKVTDEDIMPISHDTASVERYVWEENVVRHKFRISNSEMFTTTRIDEDEYDITVKDISSKVFGYLINSSRLYWRKELESFPEGTPDEEIDAYRAAHRFCIDGARLTASEVIAQKKCLVNKIFAIGYMLHAHKSPSRAWAPMAMDWKIGEDGECNGRSGKSFLFSQVLRQLIKTVKLSGRNAKLLDNPHVFDQVNRHTRMLLVDDCLKGLKLDAFYDNITSDMTVNPKNNQSYNIPFEVSPKIVFTTNYVPNNFDASTDARLLYMVFSDYYHQATEESDYLETRSIHDDFGKDLFGIDYTEDEWNADLNFLLQCVRFYLSACRHGDKPLPPMDNIMLRKRKQEMSGNFEAWAEAYFSPISEHLDRLIVRTDVVEDFRRYSGLKDITTAGFTKKLRAFVKYCPYTVALNPEDLCTVKPGPGRDNGRILKRVPVPGSSATALVDHIYIQTDPKVIRPLQEAMLRQEKALDDAGLVPTGTAGTEDLF